ncbi:MAG: hypothetical protein V5A27_06690 [Halapricum sp.]
MATGSRYQLEEEQIHDVLSNERRKQTLELLKNETGAVELRSLSEWIAEAESGESPPPKNVRQSVYNSLHQTHLPKLDRHGIIEYDVDRKTVSLRSKARRVDLYMEVLTPYGITWSTYYRTLTVVSLSAIIADQMDALLLPGDYPVLIASVFLFVVAISTAYQLWSNNWIQIRGLLGD